MEEFKQLEWLLGWTIVIFNAIFGLDPSFILRCLYTFLLQLPSLSHSTWLPSIIISSRLWAPRLPTLLNFILGLEREMLVMQLLYVLFQLSMIYMFVTGSVCSPEMQDKVLTADLPTGVPRGKKPRHKIWKRNMHQYYLMQRVRRRPVWRPVWDPLRKWYRPETWRWCRQVATDTQNCKPKWYCPRWCRQSYSKQTPYSGNKHSTLKSKHEWKWKKNKFCKETMKKMKQCSAS